MPPKQHGTNPKARRLARERQAVMYRAERVSARLRGSTERTGDPGAAARRDAERLSQPDPSPAGVPPATA